MLLQSWVMLGVLVVMFALLIWGRLPAWLSIRRHPDGRHDSETGLRRSATDRL